ncbi:hypothetical protein [Providencia rettgeri]|uniref:hypothetical protein n=1 Tax=Providencia rettgeri TaxID=587 RepID=UPI0018C5F07D|nr:hypothetical protein [Providencia rettgeri]MBG5923199.1 hypothetical protein [Providencia rettgeri]
MEFKGSKSPWNYNGNYCGAVEGSTEDMVACAYPMHYENAEEMKANAHLIAAAPELLDALQEIVGNHYLSDKAQSMATKAIAKALGQQ